MQSGGFMRGVFAALVLGTVPLGIVVALAVVLANTSTKGATTVTSAGAPVTVTATAPGTVSTPTTSTPSDPHVVAGAFDFVQFACGACHGWHGEGGVSPDVPALTGVGGLSVASLKGIIDHGLGVKSNPSKPYMPVWGAVISRQQVSDLVSYIKAGLPAVPGASPRTVPAGADAAAQGEVLYVLDGCINCHGPNGLGGVPNPSSPDKSIPVLSGADFRKQFNTPAKIAAVIESGSVLGRQPIVSMPHWGGILSKQEVGDLVAYLHTLK